MFVLGLTGSIGMGKSTTAEMFGEAGVAVHDADATVHRLYEGEAVPMVEAAFPGTTQDGKVDRALLAKRVLNDGDALKRLETLVHPLVRRAEEKFLADAAARGDKIVVLDIPLLYETKAEGRVDAVAVVSAGDAQQRERVLSRPGMTVEKFEAILAKQVPDTEKRHRADFVVDSSQGLDVARSQVQEILRAVDKMPIRRS